ncbi:hypothetical protein ACJX0J_022264 [Zea mays]
MNNNMVLKLSKIHVTIHKKHATTQVDLHNPQLDREDDAATSFFFAGTHNIHIILQIRRVYIYLEIHIHATTFLFVLKSVLCDMWMMLLVVLDMGQHLLILKFLSHVTLLELIFVH